MNDRIFVVSNENFKDLITDNSIVLVDFWANWCAPCKILSPIIDEIAKETDITVAKCNIDECMDLAEDMNIASIPSIYLYKNGEIVEKIIGFRQKNNLMLLIDKYKNN